MKTSTETAGPLRHNPRMLEGVYVPSPRVRALSLEGTDDAEGLEGVDGRRLAGADVGDQAQV